MNNKVKFLREYVRTSIKNTREEEPTYCSAEAGSREAYSVNKGQGECK